MNRKSFTRSAPALIPLAALVIGGNSIATGGSAGDYRQFQFSASQPYFDQDGKVDFGTYNGFRRYHSECHTCHGPAGLGSSYAPSLVSPANMLSFQAFVDVIVKGRSSRENFVMPSFADNMNVLPYLDDIYAYLKARADGVIPTAARPQHFPKVSVTSRLAGQPPVGGMGKGGHQ